MKTTITKTGMGTFSVTTDTLMSDGTYDGDGFMRLDGNLLRSIERKGLIRIGGLKKITLGPKSLALVSSMIIGESITVS
jgi:hypothetical protein